MSCFRHQPYFHDVYHSVNSHIIFWEMCDISLSRNASRQPLLQVLCSKEPRSSPPKRQLVGGAQDDEAGEPPRQLGMLVSLASEVQEVAAIPCHHRQACIA